MITDKEQNFNLKLDRIENHFEWNFNTDNLKILYYECFKYKKEFNELFFLKIQESLLESIKKENPKNIVKCYIFLALNYNGTKIENYYKVWKQIGRHFETGGLIPIQEEPFGKYYIGLAEFKEADLKKALIIENAYSSKCFIMIDTSEQGNILSITELASTFLVKENKGFENVINEYCTKNISVIRVGDDGDEWEVALIFKGKL